MPQAQYQFLLDLANTKFQTDLISCGLAAADQPSTYDITNKVMEASIRRGRDNELDPFGPGSMTLLLDNTDWRFTPDYGASPLYGKLRPGAMVTARVPVPDYTGLVSWWTLDEAAASTRYDSYGTNHLTPTSGGVSVVDGVVNRAASFSYLTSECLSVASNSSLQVGDIDFSVCFWVYLPTNRAVSADIISKWDGATNCQWAVVHNGLSLYFYVSSDGTVAGTTQVQCATALLPNTWNFVTCFHDSVNNVIGISVNNGTFDTKAYSSGVYASGTASLTIGGVNGSGDFTGYVDSVSFWKRVLPSVTVTTAIVTLLNDTFTDTNGTLLTAHTPETGGPWTDLTAAMQIQSGFARRSGAANPPFSVVSLAYADVSGTATVKTSAFRQVEVILRASDASNMWRLFLTDNGTTQIIYEYNGGGLTSRASAAPSITAGTAYNLTFSASGNTITFTVDGLSTISYASATFNNTATKHGVASNTDTNGAGFDRITISG